MKQEAEEYAPCNHNKPPYFLNIHPQCNTSHRTICLKCYMNIAKSNGSQIVGYLKELEEVQVTVIQIQNVQDLIQIGDKQIILNLYNDYKEELERMTQQIIKQTESDVDQIKECLSKLQQKIDMCKQFRLKIVDCDNLFNFEDFQQSLLEFQSNKDPQCRENLNISSTTLVGQLNNPLFPEIVLKFQEMLKLQEQIKEFQEQSTTLLNNQIQQMISKNSIENHTLEEIKIYQSIKSDQNQNINAQPEIPPTIQLVCQKHQNNTYNSIDIRASSEMNNRILCEQCIQELRLSLTDWCPFNQFKFEKLFQSENNELVINKYLKQKKELEENIKKFLEKIESHLIIIAQLSTAVKDQQIAIIELRQGLKDPQGFFNSVEMIDKFHSLIRNRQITQEEWNIFRQWLQDTITKIHNPQYQILNDEFQRMKQSSNLVAQYTNTYDRTFQTHFAKINTQYLRNSLCPFQFQDILIARLKKPMSKCQLLFKRTFVNPKPPMKLTIVENVTNTLMFIKLENNRIIGAYTPIAWKDGAVLLPGEYIRDESCQSFIFSVTNQEIYPLKRENYSQAIWFSKDFLPWFGESDLGLQKNYTVSSELNCCYTWDGPQNNSQNHLLGSPEQKIIELEIYHIP